MEMRVKRIVAMLLCLLMTWGLSPVSAWAVDDAATAASEQADSKLAPTQEPATEPTPALTATSTEEPTSKTTAELAEELTPEPANTPELTDTPEPAEPSEPSEEAISYLPFDQSRTANDVTVRVSAPEGVFPDGAGNRRYISSEERAHLLLRKPYSLPSKLNVEANLVVRGFEKNDITAHGIPAFVPQTSMRVRYRNFA